MNYIKVWAHDLAQQEGREDQPSKGREYLVFWLCSSRGKLASGEVGQQRRSQGHRGRQRADVVPEMVARMLGPSPRWCSTERSLLRPPGCGAARRADEENRPRPRARRLQAVGQGACGQGQFSPAYLLVANFTCVGRAVTLQREKIEGKEDII